MKKREFILSGANSILKSILFLALAAIFAFSIFAYSAAADVFTGNATIQNYDVNSSSTFNLTNRSVGAGGHIKFNNGSFNSFIEAIGNASLMPLGFFSGDFSGDAFSNDFVQVPNESFTDFFGTKDYVHSSQAFVFPGDIVAFRVANASGSLFYGAIFIKQLNQGANITFQYKFNNQTGNNTFAALTGCAEHQNFTACISDLQNGCYWSPAGTCISSTGPKDIPTAECHMLPRSACDVISNNTCSWDANQGRSGECEEGAGFDYALGFNCTAIVNATFCDNQPFTERTGLCTWNGTACNINKTKTFEDLPDPPAFSCEAAGYANNQTNCEILANDFYMPCGWNNQTNRCEDQFFDFTRFDDFEDIGSETTCKSMGGSWRTETAFDPLSNQVTSESWCEFGMEIKIFSSIGSGGASFGGGDGTLNDCSRDCFACEFNSTGGLWPNSGNASSACANSAAGCVFKQDTNAFNGYGWCNPAAGFGGFNCDSYCGDCNLQPDPQAACSNSAAGCRWDNFTSFCIGSGTKSCAQDCMQCFDQNSCGNSTANGGCQWDSSAFFCKPQGGNFEICFDGIDNDNNGKTDCADFKCGSDPFCAGSIFDTNNCFQYDTFAYGAGAQGNCTGATGCTWITDSFNFSFCGRQSEQCFMNLTMQTDQASCDSFGGGDVCKFKTASVCTENSTMVQNCFAARNQTDCDSTTGCLWSPDFNFCDTKAIITCEQNQTLQADQNLCENAGCAWIADQFSMFEGGFHENCVSPCFDPSITSAATCTNATNGTSFANGTCVWQNGFCEPKDFMGGCFDNDGDISACRANSNCVWFDDPFGMLRNPNGSTDFRDARFPQQTWLAVGLQYPIGGRNESSYILNKTDGEYIRLLMAKDTENAPAEAFNITRLSCNSTIIMEYNWTSDGCQIGACNSYNTSACGGSTLHYFFSNATRSLEALWEVPVQSLRLDSVLNDNNATNTVNTSTVIVDGNLTEHMPENSTALDGATNATRVRTAPGFCNDGFSNQFFKGMDMDPPIIIAPDTTGAADDPSEPYLDIQGLGVKKTPEAYMYGIPTLSMASSAICNGVPIQGQAVGTGKNTSKFYLYLDTNGVSTGGCAASNNASVAGFEYAFRYVGEISQDTGKLSETLLAQQCTNSQWTATNIPFKADKAKGCGFVNGPIFAIGKDSFAGKTNVNTTIGWRAYAASAHNAGNASNVSDSVGPGTVDFKGIDAEVIDCTSTKDKDNSQCSKFKQFGFFPGEFGPACLDGKDNDGDGLTDCNDFDCKYDPFFCSGSFASIADDTNAPSLAWTKINSKIPTALTFIFDTDEPSNGTVKFYNNDTTCANINNTINDKALDDGDVFTNYRPHHVADLSGLAANTTYFYKYTVCDPSDNCAVSKCSNVTTALAHSNVTFKLEIPPNWTVDIPSINLSNFSSQYALKASTEKLYNMNITINSTNANSSLKLVGMDIFEKQTLNLSQFFTGSSLLGIDANQYQSFKQKTGLDQAIVKIPTSSKADKLQHCDDNGANCKEVTSKVSCSFNDTFAECLIPDAVGLGFSTYKATITATNNNNNNGGGGGSSGTTSSASSGSGGATGAVTAEAPAVKEAAPATNIMEGNANAISLQAPAGNQVTQTNVKLEEGASVSFIVKASSEAISEVHSVKVEKISPNSATITVASTPQTFELNVGETRDVDVDSDGADDIRVVLNSVDAKLNYADINVALLTQGKSLPAAKQIEAQPAEEKEQPKYLIPTLVQSGLLATVLIVLAVIFVVIRVKAKKKR